MGLAYIKASIASPARSVASLLARAYGDAANPCRSPDQAHCDRHCLVVSIMHATSSYLDPTSADPAVVGEAMACARFPARSVASLLERACGKGGTYVVGSGLCHLA